MVTRDSSITANIGAMFAEFEEQFDIFQNTALYIPRLLLNLPDIVVALHQMAHLLVLHAMFNRQFGSGSEMFEQLRRTVH